MHSRHPPVRERPDWTQVGIGAERPDAVDKVRGAARYPSDRPDGDELVGAVLRSTRTHGRVVDLGLDAARDVPGVECVVGREDLLGPFDDRVRHYGDVVAAVAAEDGEAAAAALDAIAYEVEPLDAVYDPEAAYREDAPRVHRPDSGFVRAARRHEFTVENPAYVRNVDDYHRLAVGDVDAGFDAAAHVYEAEYTSPRVSHCNLDTHHCVAEWDDGTLRLVETIGAPGAAEEKLAALFALDADTDPDADAGGIDVEVELPPTSGSSFGARSIPKLTLEPVAATLAKRTGRPVRLRFDRDEEFAAGETRHRTRYRIKTGVSAAGRLVALELDVLADTGGYPNGVGHIVTANSMARPLELYDVEHYRFEGVSVYTNNLPAGEYRGIGTTQLTFALDSHLDEVARRLGVDPGAFRRANFVEAGHERPHTGVPIESCGVVDCLERGGERFDRLRRGPSADPAVLRGVGLAAGTHTTASGSADGERSEARITLGADGRVLLETPAVDLGQGSETVLSQMASHVLGVSRDRIDVARFPAGEPVDDRLGSVASRTTYVIGAAVEDAAASLASTLRERAADRLGVPSDEADRIDLRADAAHAPDGASVRLHTLVPADGGTGGHDADGETGGDAKRGAGEDTDADGASITVRGRAESAHTPPGYGVHFAEVEVDTGTGAVTVTAYVAAQDVGFAVNPKTVEGQLEGAIAHGVEFALHSELLLHDGRPTNATLADYPVVSPAELPDAVACELIESNEDTGPFGAKGVGTPSLPPVAPAILNALRDATGVRFAEPPVTDETVYRALGGR